MKTAQTVIIGKTASIILRALAESRGRVSFDQLVNAVARARGVRIDDLVTACRVSLDVRDALRQLQASGRIATHADPGRGSRFSLVDRDSVAHEVT